MANLLRREVENQLIMSGVTPDSIIVIGVSGGPDSLALLHILKGIFSNDNLVVGHLNHKLRKEADAEAEFINQTAEAWNIPIFLGEEDVRTLAESQGRSIEEAARIARYDFLLKLAKDQGANFIMVAHHADDQVETVFLNLLRGSGLSGLKGMEQVRSFPGEPNIRLVRPFLFTWHEAIVSYCREQGLKPLIDQSNDDLTFRRNLIRREIVPRLSQINPGFKQHVQQMADMIKAEEAYLFQQSNKAFLEITLEKNDRLLRLDRDRWRALPLSMQRRTLRLAVYHFHGTMLDISYRTIYQACQVASSGLTGAASALPGNLKLEVGYTDLVISPQMTTQMTSQPQLKSAEIKSLPIPGIVELGAGWQVSSEIKKISMDEILENDDPWRAYVSVNDDKDLWLRSRIPGERFQPLGMGGRSVSLQDFMVNIKLPAEFRNNWPIVATDAHPVWLTGYRIDERAKVSSTENEIVILKCRRAE